MFEGIIQGLGRVTAVADDGNTRRLSVDLDGSVDPAAFGSIALGGSVAVNGVCLTSVGCAGTIHHFDVIAETIARTNLGRLVGGDRVNIELPLRFGAGINGHLVAGHVDGTATITEVVRDCDDVRMVLALPVALVTFVVMKGSIAVDGISLTVASVDRSDQQVSVALIPYTLKLTTLGFRQPGDQVNIEVDQHLRLAHAATASQLAQLTARLQSLEERFSDLVPSGKKEHSRHSL